MTTGSGRPSLHIPLRVRTWLAAWRLVERLLYRGRDYTIVVPNGFRLYTPWFATDDEAPFSVAYRAATAGGPVIVTRDRCYVLNSFARRPVEGDVAECGVLTGGTAHLLAATMANEGSPATFHLFDTFGGMPDTADPARDFHAPGDFAETSLERVRSRLAAYPNVRFHPGFVPDTFAELDDETRFALVHVDLDSYPSVRDACAGLWPRVVPGGAMIFDDYGFRHLRHAARRAVDEYFSDQPDKPIVLPTGQAFVLRSR
jgi:O-methyltransferase